MKTKNLEKPKQITISDAARLLGVTTKTLRNWEKQGKIQTYRTLGGHRRLSIDDVNSLKNQNVNTKKETTLIYARVSTRDQKDSLERQTQRLKDFCSQKSWKSEIYKDIASGLNCHRKQFLKLLKRLVDEEVTRVIVEYKDRLVRVGFEIFEVYCINLGVEIIVVHDSPSKEFEQELSEDIISLVTIYSARFNGRRKKNGSLCRNFW